MTFRSSRSCAAKPSHVHGRAPASPRTAATRGCPRVQREGSSFVLRVLVAVVLLLLPVLEACSASPQHLNRIDLLGTRNLRDLGGYETVDGRRVKRGVLFRSDDLADLSYRDLETLAALGLKTIYDLRSEAEREADPDLLPRGNPPKVVEIPMRYEPLDRPVIRRRILSAQVDEGDFHRLMRDAYRTYALEHRGEISVLLVGLAEPGTVPALFHCKDGKDRTGIAAAVLLRALGVPRETVLEDYMASNEFLSAWASRLSWLASAGSLFRVPPGEVRALLEVRPEYLEAAFAAIEARYGAFEVYLREGLGIDDATVEQLRAVLLD